MYENESAHVRLGIEFLQAMTEEDYLLDPGSPAKFRVYTELP